MTTPIAPLAQQLAAHGIRCVLIGVSGANLYAPAGQAPSSLAITSLSAARRRQPRGSVARCEAAALDLWLGDEPLDRPRDDWLAERMIERRTLTRVTSPNELLVDLTLVMEGFDFETVWDARRVTRTRYSSLPTWMRCSSC